MFPHTKRCHTIENMPNYLSLGLAEELEGSLVQIRKICGDFLPLITDDSWHHLDEDGNGVLILVILWI